MTTSAWRRTRMGYLSADHQWFVERGAPMTCGGTAWLIWRQVEGSVAVGWTADPMEAQVAERVGPVRRGGSPYLVENGQYLRALAELTLGEATPRSGGGRDLYQHVADAGSLAEAKGTVVHLQGL